MDVTTSTTGRTGARHGRRVALGAIVGAAALVLAGCGGETGAAPATSASAATSSSTEAAAALPLVYGVFATPLEEPWDGAIHTALEAAAADGTITYKYVDDVETSDAMERTLRDIATNQKPDIIFGDAFAAEEAVRAVAVDFPEIAFAFGSGGESVAPNFSVFDNWMQDPAYLAGMLAGGLTTSNVVGVVGAMPIPEVNRIVNGFIEGVKEVNPAVTVKVTFINSFFDPATAKQAAEAQIAAGADVLFAERDGVVAAAAEKSLPVIGMMVDQKDQAPDYVLTSLLWDMRPTVDHVVEQVKAGTYAGADLGEFSFMANGGSSIAPISTDVTYAVPAELLTKVSTRQDEILAGTFTVDVNQDAPAGSVDLAAG